MGGAASTKAAVIGGQLMGFARRGSYRKVYADRGPGAVEDYENTIPMLVEKDAGNPTQSLPQRVCPHKGVYNKDGVPMCGFCFQEPNNGLTPEQSFAAFTESLWVVCKQVCWRPCHLNRPGLKEVLTYEEKVKIAFDAITSPKVLMKLLDKSTRNPLALANTIAHRRLLDHYRTPEYRQRYDDNRKVLLISQMKFPKGGENDDDLRTDSDKLDWLASRSPAAIAASYGYDSALTHKTDATTHALIRAVEASDRIRIFPGMKLMWGRENIERLVEIAKDGLAKLPKEPFDHSILIGLRADAYGLKGDRTKGTSSWRYIARWATDSRGVNTTERQVRYAFEVGTAQVRAHIISKLTPDLGQIIRETPARGLIKPFKKPKP